MRLSIILLFVSVVFTSYSQTPELTKLRDLFNDGKHEKVKEQLFEVSNNPTNRKHYLYWVLKGSIDLQSIAAKSSKEFDPNDLESVYEDFEKAIKISNYIELKWITKTLYNDLPL